MPVLRDGAPAPATAGDGVTAYPPVRNRVLLILASAILLAALTLPFVTHAPNRLLSGRPISLIAVAPGTNLLALLPVVILLAGPFLPQRRRSHIAVALAAAFLLPALCWVAGAQARVLAETAAAAARTSPGAAFWTCFLCCGLALIDAAHRLNLSVPLGTLCAAALGAVLVLLAATGALDQLSLMKEYANRRDVLADALGRHIGIVAAALAPTLLLGVPLGVLAARHRTFAAALFPALNIVQTIPSIALFALLMAPLSSLAKAFPGLATLGISGVGLAPAAIALVLYSLLPIVRNVREGIAGVSPAAREAARGMGMSAGQVFWRVELPLALPVFLSGLRIVTVQAIGLAAVAALIGAGGFGSIMFQGLFANALDVVVLGTLPIILLALATDGVLKLATAFAERAPR